MKCAMSTMKNIAAAAMTLAVVFGFAGFKPVTANAAQVAVPAAASVEEENSYFEEDAYQRSFLTLINNERAQAGLAPVALGDSSHNAAAMKRAEELAVSYSYVRPSGQRDFTVRQRTASAMFLSARTTWPAAPPPIPQWISGWLPILPASAS